MRARAEVTTFCVAVLTGWALSSAMGLGRPLAPQAAVAASPSMTATKRARSALDGANAAWRRGEFARADDLLREAWKSPATRALASERLLSLHDDPRFALPPDEPAIQRSAELLGEGFARYETEHFVILSDASPDWSRNKGRLLERAHHQFFRFTKRLEYPVTPPSRKLLCVLISDHAMYRAFARSHDGVEAPWIAGYYAGLSNRVVFYDDRTGPAFARALGELDEFEQNATDLRSQARRGDEAALSLHARADHLTERIRAERARLIEEAERASEAKTIHEAIHLLSFNCGLQSRAHQYPFWLTEGLAVAFETDTPRSAFGPDRPTPERGASFHEHVRQRRVPPLEDVVGMVFITSEDPLEVDVLYAAAHALFEHLALRQRRDLAAYLTAIVAEDAGTIASERHIELFEEHFGSIRALERRLERAALR